MFLVSDGRKLYDKQACSQRQQDHLAASCEGQSRHDYENQQRDDRVKRDRCGDIFLVPFQFGEHRHCEGRRQKEQQQD